jgi:hypothetical protein
MILDITKIQASTRGSLTPEIVCVTTLLSPRTESRGCDTLGFAHYRRWSGRLWRLWAYGLRLVDSNKNGSEAIQGEREGTRKNIQMNCRT